VPKSFETCLHFELTFETTQHTCWYAANLFRGIFNKKWRQLSCLCQYISALKTIEIQQFPHFGPYYNWPHLTHTVNFAVWPNVQKLRGILWTAVRCVEMSQVWWRVGMWSDEGRSGIEQQTAEWCWMRDITSLDEEQIIADSRTEVSWIPTQSAAEGLCRLIVKSSRLPAVLVCWLTLIFVISN